MDRQAAVTMLSYYANFAHIMGDPNGPGLPVWPAYSAAAAQRMAFDADGAVAAALATDRLRLISESQSAGPWCPEVKQAGRWGGGWARFGEVRNTGARAPLGRGTKRRLTMSTPKTLKELYADEMKDLWSANDQMARVVTILAGKAHDAQLKQNLEQSVQGISKHANALKALIQGTGAQVSPDHCRGMEGLAKEAIKHVVEEAPDNGDLRDMEIIAQYQRMCHYGIAGFGSAAAYASALGMKEDVSKLKGIVSDIYKSDEYASSLSQKAAQIAPKSA